MGHFYSQLKSLISFIILIINFPPLKLALFTVILHYVLLLHKLDKTVLGFGLLLIDVHEY